jgi:hypothetical protein
VNYTLPISLYYSTHKALKTHNKSSLSDGSVIVHYHIKSSHHAFGSSFRVHESLSVTTSHALWSHTAPPAFYTAPCCLVLPALSPVTLPWDVLPRHRGGGGGVLTCLLCYSGKRCHVTAVEGGGRLHSANTQQYDCVSFHQEMSEKPIWQILSESMSCDQLCKNK